MSEVTLAAILCTGGLDVIRKEAWSFYRTSSGVRLCWELEEPKGPKGSSSLDPLGWAGALALVLILQGYLAHKKTPTPLGP